MKVYEVMFWQEGPGRSDYRTVRVIAVDRKAAVDFVNKAHAVYKVDQPMTKAILVRSRTKDAYELRD